jgi:SAM-dependent methyltransferase
MTEIATVDPTNAEQARAWDGEEGDYWATHAAQFDRCLAGYHDTFMAAAEIAPGERVLDVGCGTGQTTRAAARSATGGRALGVDLSGPMIELARRLAAEQGVQNAEFRQADAQLHPFEPASFDVAISRTGTMFFGDPAAAFRNLAGALRPEGRLVLLAWQPPSANEWIGALSSALAAGRELPTPPVGAPGPFGQSDPEQVRAVLSGAGFTDIAVTGLTEPMWWGADAEAAYEFAIGMLGWMLQGLDEDGQQRARSGLRDTLVAHSTPTGVLFGSATWLITARRAG